MGSELPVKSAYPHENDGPRILGAVLGITTIAVITMTARLYVRIKLISNVGWDVGLHKASVWTHGADNFRIIAWHSQHFLFVIPRIQQESCG